MCVWGGCDWLLLLSILLSKFTHVVACISGSFLLLIIFYYEYILFIHQLIGIGFCFFFLLWTMLLWTFVTNLCVDIYFHFSWVRNLGVELLDYMINLFNFLRNYQTVFQSGYTILHIVSNVTGYQFLCILTSTYYCVWFQWLGGSSIPL